MSLTSNKLGYLSQGQNTALSYVIFPLQISHQR